MSGDIRENISRSEMACRCGNCNFVVADTELVDVLQETVDFFEIQIQRKIILQISSGNRCYVHNEYVQAEYYARRNKVYTPGSSKSPHVDGIAADFKLWYREGSLRIQIPARTINDYLRRKYSNKYGIGLYYNRVHIDVKPGRARRWNG